MLKVKQTKVVWKTLSHSGHVYLEINLIVLLPGKCAWYGTVCVLLKEREKQLRVLSALWLSDIMKIVGEILKLDIPAFHCSHPKSSS